MSLAHMFPAYDHIHHCAGKLEGVQVGLIPVEGNIHGSHAVIVLEGEKLIQMPIMPQAAANRAFRDVVSRLNDLSVGA